MLSSIFGVILVKRLGWRRVEGWGGGDIWCARCGPLCVCVQTIISASVCVRFDANARHRVGALIMVMTAQKRSCFSVFEKSHRFACCCVSRFAFFPCGIHVSVTLTTFSYARYALRPWVGLARRALDNNNARCRVRARHAEYFNRMEEHLSRRRLVSLAIIIWPALKCRMGAITCTLSPSPYLCTNHDQSNTPTYTGAQLAVLARCPAVGICHIMKLTFQSLILLNMFVFATVGFCHKYC